MELTIGAILRRIAETPLSTAAHKLASIILEGIAWKDGRGFVAHGGAVRALRCRCTEALDISSAVQTADDKATTAAITICQRQRDRIHLECDPEVRR